MTYRSSFKVTADLIPRASRIFFTFTLFLLFLQSSPLSAQPFIETENHRENVDNYYERGLEEQEKDNYERALEIWFEAKSSLPEPDFRISQSYIEMVTGRQMKGYYEKASELYNWGLSGKIENPEKEALLRELELLRPLIKNRDFRSFERAIEQGDAGALSGLENFWNSVDPSPLRSYNERLLEHWERIAHAKEHYTKRSSDELDDRGHIYIKYGEPYYSKEGMLMYKSSLVNMLLNDGIEAPAFGTDEDIRISHSQKFNLEMRVRQLHAYPEYQVWIYRSLTDDTQNTIFLFGTRGGSGSFRKISSVEDFIPNEAYRTSGQNNYSISESVMRRSQSDSEDAQFDTGRQSRNITPSISISPALILQLMYYNQLAALDEYFGRAYNEMMNRYTDRSNTHKSGLAREFGTMYGNELIHIQNAAPDEKSEYASEIISIPVSTNSYRFLDEDNRPYLKVYTLSDFEEAVYYDLLKETNSLQTDIENRYMFLTGYQLRDRADNRLDEKTGTTPVSSLEQPVNIYDIPYETGSESIVISHELHKRSEMEDSTISSATAFPQSLKGISNSRIDMPEPLNTGELVLSDILLGYGETADEVDPAEFSDGTAQDFTIAHTKEIPADADLILYYELYNLEPQGTGEVSEYSFEYSIKRKAKGLFGRSSDDQLSITVNNTVIGERDENILTIDTSKLENGEYILDIEIMDLNANTEFVKRLDFSIR